MNEQATNPTETPRRRRRWPWYLGTFVLLLVAWQVVSSVSSVPAPLTTAAAVTDKVYEAVYSDDIKQRAAELPREVNILLVGLDNRLASHDNHADAIHVISIKTKDSVSAEIISIPRGTEVTGYGIEDDLSFMANVRALRGRNTFIKAVSKLVGKKINYYVEVSFSQVMGVLELLGYKDPATALQFLRHRKSFKLGDVQRSFNQGKFLRTQLVRRADLLTGAKGELLIRMGLGMVDTDIDFNTAQALVYLMKNANALDSVHITQSMRPRINLARLDSIDTPDPDNVAQVVNRLVRRTGDQIDDLGRYNPYPRLNSIVVHAEAQKSGRAALAILEPAYEQKAWLQIQERPQRQELRDRIETVLERSYLELKKPDMAAAVKKYMAEERLAFQDAERQTRQFAYGRRPGVHKKESSDPVAAARAKQDEIGQKQTHIEPQDPQSPATNNVSNDPVQTPPQQTPPKQEETPVQTVSNPETPKQDAPKVEAPKQDAPPQEAPKRSVLPKQASVTNTPAHTPKATAPKASTTKAAAPKTPAAKSGTAKTSTAKTSARQPAKQPAKQPVAPKHATNVTPHVYDIPKGR